MLGVLVYRRTCVPISILFESLSAGAEYAQISGLIRGSGQSKQTDRIVDRAPS